MAKAKIKSPTEIIENIDRPWLESSYSKYPGKELKHTSFARGPRIVTPNIPLAALFRKKKDRTWIHTHTSHEGYTTTVLPSQSDILYFLEDKSSRYSGIAQTDPETGKVKGYLIMKKTKNTLKARGHGDKLEKYLCGVRAPIKQFEDLCTYFNIKYRFVPAKGFKYGGEEFYPNSDVKIKKEKSLETKLALIIGISALTLSLIFLSPNLTGNAIANLTTKTSSIIGAGLFIVGIVGSYFYFKKE